MRFGFRDVTPPYFGLSLTRDERVNRKEREK